MMVDLLLHDKTKRNRRSPHTNLFYSSVRHIDMSNESMSNTMAKYAEEYD